MSRSPESCKQHNASLAISISKLNSDENNYSFCIFRILMCADENKMAKHSIFIAKMVEQNARGYTN